MSLRDAQGNAVGTASPGALAAVEQALWRMMSFYGMPVDDLDAAIAADPAWLLPRVMKAGFLLGLTEPSLAADGIAALAAAEPLAAGANERERAHFGAVRLVARGDWRGASDTWEQILLAHPRDALALQWALLFDFYRGDALALRQRAARVLPEWSADDALHPYVLGLYAFGLEESNLYAEAEEAGRRALAGAARVPWAIHAVAHVMEMQGRHEEGARWMGEWRPSWGEGNGFAGHLGWHEALFALETLDHAAALAVFDRYLNPQATEITLQRVDAASLLWRLQLQGADVGARRQALLGGWDLDPARAGGSAFNDVHALIALVGAGKLGRAEAWATAAIATAERSAGWNHEVMNDLGAPLMLGLLDFAAGRYDAAAEAIYRVRPISARLGGSHAQRDLIDQTLMAASTRGCSRAAGRALLNERRLAKPATPLTEWWARSLAAA
ncbi:MAG: tetratricopeptide repeat protein [Caldimonas sp.]